MEKEKTPLEDNQEQTKTQGLIPTEFQEEPKCEEEVEKPVDKKKKKPKMDKEKKSMIGLIAGGIVLSSCFGFTGGYLASNMSSNGKKEVLYQAIDRTTSTGVKDDEQLSIADIAKLNANSVVEIRTETTTTGKYLGDYVEEGAGSGVILSKDGYIVTNYHVIEDATKVKVTLHDGTVYEATLVGIDSKTDLAVLKIDAKDLQAVVLGNSDNLIVGELAVAIGNPLGELGGTVTDGIISATSRDVSVNGEIMTLLQTNAAVNPGNSGGGLFNGRGELIGIVNAKQIGSDIEGLGFAIPVNTVKKVVEEIIENGYVSGRVRMGITFVEIKDIQTASQYGVNQLGLYVHEVDSSMNAAKAGLQKGDFVTEINGEEVNSIAEIKKMLNEMNVGDKITLSILRDNKSKEITFILQEAKK